MCAGGVVAAGRALLLHGSTGTHERGQNATRARARVAWSAGAVATPTQSRLFADVRVILIADGEGTRVGHFRVGVVDDLLEPGREHDVRLLIWRIHGTTCAVKRSVPFC